MVNGISHRSVHRGVLTSSGGPNKSLLFNGLNNGSMVAFHSSLSFAQRGILEGLASQATQGRRLVATSTQSCF